MLSGRLAGMAVRPFPLQSTMLLLQVHMAGQEPPPMLHGWRLLDSWWPEEKRNCVSGETGGNMMRRGEYAAPTGVWAQVDLVDFQWEQHDSKQDYRERLFAGGFVCWHGAALALMWSSNSSAAVHVINPLCFINWIANEDTFPGMFWHWEERNETPYSWLYCKAVHPWESMGKKLGYLSKECHGILRGEERHE